MKLSYKIAAILFLGIILAEVGVVFLISPQLKVSFDAFKIIFAILLVAPPITLLVWFLIHNTLLNPISHLNNLFRTIASGNLSKRVQIKALDELGELAENLNTVINNLVSGLQNMANSLSNVKSQQVELTKNYDELSKEKSKAEAIITSIGDGVIAIDNLNKIILYNQEASRLTGYSSEEVLNQPYYIFLKFQDETTGTPHDLIPKALQGSGVQNDNKLILLRKDDSKISVFCKISPILDQKNTIGVVVALRDATGNPN